MYYAVRKGHTTGVFDNWPEAQEATSGFSGPEYKKFKTKEEAEAYLDNRDVWVEQIAEDCGFNSASHFARAFRQETDISPTAFRAISF